MTNSSRGGPDRRADARRAGPKGRARPASRVKENFFKIFLDTGCGSLV